MSDYRHALPDVAQFLFHARREHLTDARLVSVDGEDKQERQDDQRDIHPNGDRGHGVHQFTEATAIDGTALDEHDVELAEEEAHLHDRSNSGKEARKDAGQDADRQN